MLGYFRKKTLHKISSNKIMNNNFLFKRLKKNININIGFLRILINGVDYIYNFENVS
jgi:hypothetical protein